MSTRDGEELDLRVRATPEALHWGYSLTQDEGETRITMGVAWLVYSPQTSARHILRHQGFLLWAADDSGSLFSRLAEVGNSDSEESVDSRISQLSLGPVPSDFESRVVPVLNHFLEGPRPVGFETRSTSLRLYTFIDAATP